MASTLSASFLSTLQSVNKTLKTNLFRVTSAWQSVQFSSSATTNPVIERAKLQNRIKANDLECHKQMENGLFFLYHRGKPMLATKEVQRHVREPILSTFKDAADIKPGLKSDSVFLKVSPETGKPFFVTQLADDVNVTEVESRFDGKFVDMRVAMFNVDEDRWSRFLCQASSLLSWHRKLRFCSSCGHEMGRNLAGNQRECTSCKTVQYPTTFPVAIVLLTTPDHSKALLIRQPKYPPGMFSCVAGFVDAGETLFECVQREVAEEVSVEILADPEIRLMGSQFWPFPSGSLMMGCMAYVDPKADPKPCMEEVELARWFSPAEVSEALERVRKNPYMRIKNEDPRKIFVPPKGAIANFLLKTWLEKFVKS